MATKKRTATKKSKATKRTSQGAGGTARTRSAVIDVTDDSADAVIARVKLLCDNDTEVVFTRAGARLVMRLQDRE